MDDIVRTTEQTAVIEEARTYVDEIGPIDMTNRGQLVGHLMTAEVLLKRFVDAFAEPANT